MSTSIPLFILYGSATGNSEQIAKALAASLPKVNSPLYTSIVTCEGNAFRAKCNGYWNREPTKGKYAVVVITSTTGNGDAPENISRFIRFIKRKDEVKKQPFRNVCFSVLALGDTNYDQFCASGVIVDKKMRELGGTQLQKLCMADEGTGLEETVEPWTDGIIRVLERGCGRFDDVEEKKEEEIDIVVEQKVTDVKKVEDVISSNGEVADEKKEETPIPQDKEISSNKAIQALIALTETLNVSIPPSIPDSSLPSLLPHSESTNGLQESSLVEEPHKRDRAPSIVSMSSASSGCQYNLANPYESPILSARYLTNTTSNSSLEDLSSSETHFKVNDDKDMKRVLEVTLGLPDDIIPVDFFQPGDSIGLVVDNRYTTEYSTLMSLFQRRGLDITKEGVLLHSNGKDTSSIKDGFLKTDITSPIKKRILLHLSQVTSDPNEEYYLKLLSSKVGSTLYESYIMEQQRNIIDIMVDFPSCTPSPQFMYELSGAIAPRYYSVASSPYEGNVLKIALSVVDYTIGNRRKHGLASTYLELISNPLLQSQSSGCNINIQIYPKPPSTEAFRLPTNPSKPLILIGPGTGIAPFVGFLTHLQKLNEIEYQREQDCNEGTWRGMDIQHEEQLKQTKATVQKRDVYVFFGCRWSTHDYLYKSELSNFQNNGYITQLNTAFSRDADKKKTYVQNQIQLHEQEVSNLILEQDAYIYICGDGAMAKDVQSCLVNVCKQDNEKFLKELKDKNRLVLDVWS